MSQKHVKAEIPMCAFFDRLLGLFCAFVCGAVCSPKMHVITKDFCLSVLTSSLQNGSLIPVDGFREHGFTGFASHDPVCQKFFLLVVPLDHAVYGPQKTGSGWFRHSNVKHNFVTHTQLCHAELFHTQHASTTLSHTTHTLDKNGSL